MKTQQDWAYRNQPQPNACRGYISKSCAWPRGKVLGGSSSINGMFYVRGNKADYNEWSENGNIGWSFDEVLPYFKKSENFTDLKNIDKKYHGTGGYLNVESTDNIHELEKMTLMAAKELGLDIITDFNGPKQIGIARTYSTTKSGVRHSTARAFLSPVKDRTNLHVMKQALVTKLLFAPDSNKVRGVIISKDGKEIEVNVNKEIIVSGGVINSAQLLLLSGIGPKEQLQKFKIDVKQDLPVGENLQDHVFVPILYSTPGSKEITSLPNIIGAFAEYVINQKGPLSDVSPHKAVDFMNTKDPNSSVPDIQHHYIALYPSQGNLLDIFEKHDLSEEIQTKFRQINDNKYVLIVYTVLLRPKSKGKLVLKSNDPTDHPLIYANYFDEDEDLETMIRGMRHAIKLGETKTFKEAGFKLEWLEMEACKHHNKDSDDFLKCVAAELTFSLYHPVGTCKMGPSDDASAVVDPELKVRGVEGLRVADASIMPNIVRGNTNAPTIMIGEKLSDLVKKTWLDKHTEL